MFGMDEDKFEPLTSIEQAHTGVFETVMQGCIMNAGSDIIYPFAAFDEQVFSIFFTDLLCRYGGGHRLGLLYPERRELFERQYIQTY